MIARFFIIFISLVVALALTGLRMMKYRAGDEPSDKDDPLSERIVNNVNDLKDRFNRARYMDRDDGREQD